jgi:hypothetical protein
MTNYNYNDINCYLDRGWMCKIGKGVEPVDEPILINELFPTTECENKGNSTVNWVQYREKCYYTSPNIESLYRTWQSAESFCNTNGGYLASKFIYFYNKIFHNLKFRYSQSK